MNRGISMEYIVGIILLIVDAVLIASLIYMHNKNYKNNPSSVRYWNGIYTVELYEEAARQSKGRYYYYEFKLRDGKIVHVREKSSIILLILIAIMLVALFAAMLIPNYTFKLNTIVILLFVLSTLLFFIIDNAFFILRAKRILKKELLKGHIKESPIGINEIDD